MPVSQENATSALLEEWGKDKETGPERWKALRKQWLQERNPNQKTSKKNDFVDVDTVIEYLINPKHPPFPTPVPLDELVDILLELWEAEYTV